MIDAEYEAPEALETDFTGTNGLKERQSRIRHAFRDAKNVIVLNTLKGDERVAALQCLQYAKFWALSGSYATPRKVGKV